MAATKKKLALVGLSTALTPMLAIGDLAAGATCAQPTLAQFLPGDYIGSGYLSVNDFDGLTVQEHNQGTEFAVSFDGNGVVTGGTMALSGSGVAAGHSIEGGSVADWHFQGELSGTATELEAEGIFSMAIDAVIDLGGDDLGGWSGGFNREATYELVPIEADCVFVRGRVEGIGNGETLEWIAERVGGGRRTSYLDQVKEVLDRAARILDEEQAFDVDELIAIVRQLIGLNARLAADRSCGTVPRDFGPGNPAYGHLRLALRSVLQLYIGMASDAPSEHPTADVIRVLIQGLASAAIGGGAACAADAGHDAELLLAFEQLLTDRLALHRQAGQRNEILMIATVAQQFGFADLAAAADAAYRA